MTMTATQIAQLNGSNEAHRRAGIGTIIAVNEALLAGTDLASISALKKISASVSYDDFTDNLNTTGGYDLTTTLPAQATVLYSAITNVIGFTGDTSCTLLIGESGDTDRFMTGTPSIFTTAANGVSVGAPSGVVYLNAETTVSLLATSAADFSSVAAGSVTVEIFYLT